MEQGFEQKLPSELRKRTRWKMNGCIVVDDEESFSYANLKSTDIQPYLLNGNDSGLACTSMRAITPEPSLDNMRSRISQVTT